MFYDQVTLRIVAGHGGKGAVAFRREKYIPFGGPSGGEKCGLPVFSGKSNDLVNKLLIDPLTLHMKRMRFAEFTFRSIERCQISKACCHFGVIRSEGLFQD